MRHEKIYSEKKDKMSCNNNIKKSSAIVLALCLSVFIAFTSGTANGGTVYTTYTYDNLNRLTKVVYVNGKSIAYTYDAAGNQTAVESGSGSSTATNLILNPDFGSGNVNWAESTLGTSAIIINDSTKAHAGSWFAGFGGYNRAIDYIYQDVAIPANAQQPYLQFWYYIATNETTTTIAYDKIAVEIRKPADNSLLSTLATLSNLNKTTGWVQSPQYDLSAYKGQTIRLRFYTTTDTSLTTSFRIDDVSLNSSSTITITQPVLLVTTTQTYYSTIQAAYDANTATSGSTIKVQGTTLTEALVFNQNNTLTLAGGYDSSFTTVGSTMTTVSGSLTISGGAVTAANIAIQ